MEGDMVIEVKNSQVNKGIAASKWMKNFECDFYMACGDDWTDEDTFKAMPEGAFTIKVGSTSSSALYRVKDYHEIRSILKSMVS
jgi:trehalose 6-phosphate synthase/phosphatase